MHLTYIVESWFLKPPENLNEKSSPLDLTLTVTTAILLPLPPNFLNFSSSFPLEVRKSRFHCKLTHLCFAHLQTSKNIIHYFNINLAFYNIAYFSLYDITVYDVVLSRHLIRTSNFAGLWLRSVTIFLTKFLLFL